jgi:hypothetical protein
MAATKSILLLSLRLDEIETRIKGLFICFQAY